MLNDNRFIIYCAIIILFLGLALSEANVAFSESKTCSTKFINNAEKHIAKFRPLWSSNCRKKFINALKRSFSHIEHIEKQKSEIFFEYFDDYLCMYPENINDEEIDFICYIVEHHLELFFSNDFPQKESMESLYNQVEAMARSFQENILDPEKELTKDSKDKAVESFMKSFSKASKNLLYPGLKRPLTHEEIDFIKRFFPLNFDIPQNPKSKSIDWQLEGLNIVLWFVDRLTTPHRNKKMEANIPEQALKSLSSGEDMYLSWIKSPTDSVVSSEVIAYEIAFLYYLVHHDDNIQYLLGY